MKSLPIRKFLGARGSGLVYMLLVLILLNRCYLLKQGAYILKYNVKEAQDIGKLLNSEDLSAESAETLSMILDIKQFAVHSLGLKADKNYTRYVELERDYLVDVVSACEKDRFKPYIWRYCFFGSFPYKGFFEAQDALKEAQRLKVKGLDVLVRKVEAFSTLGFFVDPVYSFMKDYSVFSLAYLIIHEQSHATIFLKDEIQFNEELATFIGREGALQYIRGNYGKGAEALKEAEDYFADWDFYVSLIRTLYEELNELYESGFSREYKLKKREELFAGFRERYRCEYSARFKTEGFRKITDLPLNNAYIMSFVRYTQDLDIFYDLYRRQGSDLKATITVLKQVEKRKGDPKAYLREIIIGHE